jgi:hypothetical protein
LQVLFASRPITAVTNIVQPTIRQQTWSQSDHQSCELAPVGLRSAEIHVDRIQLRLTHQQIDIACTGARSENRVATNRGYAGRRETASVPVMAGSRCRRWDPCMPVQLLHGTLHVIPGFFLFIVLLPSRTDRENVVLLQSTGPAPSSISDVIPAYIVKRPTRPY